MNPEKGRDAAKEISPKTKAAAVGGGSAFGAAVVVTWLLGLFGVEVPSEVAIIIGGAVVWLFATYGAYLKPDPLRGELYDEESAADVLAQPGHVITADDPDYMGVVDRGNEPSESPEYTPDAVLGIGEQDDNIVPVTEDEIDEEDRYPDISQRTDADGAIRTDYDYPEDRT